MSVVGMSQPARSAGMNMWTDTNTGTALLLNIRAFSHYTRN